MCGIAGFWDFKTSLGTAAPKILERMADQLYHRGPDSAGYWSDEKSGVALAHRRLAIVELSSAGHQPMISKSGRYVIVFNGEIYNHADIRAELETYHSSISWRGHSDTETLLTAIEVLGFEAALSKTTGMFAFALWDQEEKVLLLARDRLGEKPLYYGWQNGVFLFASQCKAFRGHPSFEGQIDREALTQFFRYNCIPAPYSIYRGIKKLLPGTYLRVDLLNFRKQDCEIKTFWSLQNVIANGKTHSFAGTDADAIKFLDQLLRQVVKQQMMSDVPLGAFLSGGVDSSSVVALMQTQSKKPIKTFTIGFHESEFNEADEAKLVSHHLGTDHTELYVTPQQALEVVPKIPNIYDEPFSDSSQIPTFLVSQLSRKQVTVSLSGDGGDEIFGGYNRYLGTQKWWNKIQSVPKFQRKVLADILSWIRPSFWDGFRKGGGNLMQKIEGALRAEDANALYTHFVSHWIHPESVVINGIENRETSYGQSYNLENIVEQMMAWDTLTYLPNDILVKVDRAAMALSLETRVPFLDPRVVDFCWKLPLSMKIREGQTKWLLRQVLYQYVPKDIIERPKKGFAIPLDNWLRGPLRDWAEGLLNPSRLAKEGYLNPSTVQSAWSEHISGRRNRSQQIWDVLMFQAWLESIR
jgi:asparagine synthase (glutamine-hydrolysing)